MTAPAAEMPDPLSSDDERLMLAAVRHAAFDGWTPRILTMAAEDCGVADAGFAFPGGIAALIEAFSEWADGRMVEGLAGHDLAALKIRARIALCIRLRLEALAPYREAIRRLTAHCALPGNAGLAARLIAATVDRIWYEAGDSATDFSYYTKRALLAPVYGAAVLYWLADESDGFAATWSFVERRLDDVLKIPKFRARAFDVLDRLPNPMKFWRLLGRHRPI